MDPGNRTFYLGRYNCIEQLGTGPIGETYRAKIYGVAGFEKQFAVKRLHPQLSADEAFVARFVQAASAFAALEHSAIARVHEVNAQGAHYYIVIDLVRGLDVRRLLDSLQQRGEALSPDAAMAIALQTADALEHAHSRTNVRPGGVLHLGLTAPSVMVTYDGEVKLVDVGLLGALVQPGWSDDDALTPTLAYIAPEQWRAEPLDARADVFSLGVVLHELLGGSRVFLSDRAADLRRAIESGPPPPPPSDPRLQEIVTRALQPDRERRFTSIGEMRAAIQAIVSGRLERARADLSAVVRRLAMPRERRTGAFAAVMPPPTTGSVTPVSPAKPPPIPPAARAWAPPTPKPPVGGVLSPIPVQNTLAGIGPDDQALVPIELVELPGAATEKAMPTVAADDAETRRVVRSDEAETNRIQRVEPHHAGATSASAAPPLNDAAANATAAVERSANGANATGAPSTAATDASGRADAKANADAANAPSANGAKGDDAAAALEASWTPPKLESPPPSPMPQFAEPAVEKPDPVERPKATVPGVKLPPPGRGGRAIVGSVGLLAAAGALALYAGLSGRPQGTVTSNSQATAETANTPAANAAAANSKPTVTSTPTANSATANSPTANSPTANSHAANAQAANAQTANTQAANAQTANTQTANAQTANAPTNPAAANTPSAAPTAGNAAPAKSATGNVPSANAAHANAAATNAAAGAPATNAAPDSAHAFEIATTPPGATVFFDGEEKGPTPAKIDVAPGAHKLVLAAEGQKLVQREVNVTPGGRLDVALEPAKLPAEIAGDAGLKVRCKSHGEIRIFVDGADSGRSCPNEERISIAPGPHKIGLLSARTGQMHEVEHEVVEGNLSTRVYVKY